MKRSGSNRIPRRIGGDDDGEGSSTDSVQSDSIKSQAEPVVKRPVFGKSKKRSSLRISFGPGDAENDGDESSDSAVVTPKKSNLSRIAMEKIAARKAGSPLVSELSRPRASLDEDRPSYSKDTLTELRNSTPSTPKDLDTAATPDEDELALQAFDVTSKFGPTATLTKEQPSAIPTEAEILEKKARRARLAKGYNADEAGDAREDEDWDPTEDDEFRTNRNEITLRPKDKYGESRLVRDDEDMAEGFEDYVEDGNITLGRKAEREAQKQRRAHMAEMIADAEGSEEDSDDSEAERNAAYEAAQTRAGTYGRRGQENDEDIRAPPKAQTIPELKDVLVRLEAGVAAKEQRKQAILRQLEEIKQEKINIAERQQYIQEQLEETGQKYEKLRQEAGLPALPANGAEVPRPIERGLDSLGTTPVARREDTDDDEEDEGFRPAFHS